jgi:hypothetical protein
MPVACSRPATADVDPKSLSCHVGLVRPAGGGESQIAALKMKSEAPAQGDAWGWGRR